MKIDYSIIVTAYKEETTIQKALNQISKSIKNGFDYRTFEIIVVAPDAPTLTIAKSFLERFDIKFQIIKDNLDGKPAALNLAHEQAIGEVLILTDGDMYIEDTALSALITGFSNETIGGVSGHPVSLEDRKTMFGFFSHLHCHFADLNRKKNKFVPMSGYLYAFKNLPGIFNIPEEIRSEDSYISYKIIEAGYNISYASDALCYVRFPKNASDWLKQKTRSLGGNHQLKNYLSKFDIDKNIKPRNISEDISESINVLFYAKNFKELLWIFYLYYLRLLLWIKIILIYNKVLSKYFLKQYQVGAWERIESTKY